MPLPTLDQLAALAREAGDAILEIYAGDFAVVHKDDNSPVTEADLAAHRVIVDGLRALTPDIPIISEEHDEHAQLPEGSRFWLVDPLDGTKSFVRRTGEFTVNIGLIDGDMPVLGVIVVPVQGVTYAGQVGQGAWKEDTEGRRDITTRPPPADGLDVLVSQAHMSPKTDAFLKDITVRERVKASSSLKFCVVAEGAADLYPRLGPTMEWDTAAGQAILMAAGGRVVTPEGQPFTYNKPDYCNGEFLAWGR